MGEKVLSLMTPRMICNLLLAVAVLWSVVVFWRHNRGALPFYLVYCGIVVAMFNVLLTALGQA